MSQRYQLTSQALSHRFRKVLHRFVQRKYSPKLPRGPFILLIDGIWVSFNNQPWILYLGAVKPIDGHHATFLDPLLLKGTESLKRWSQFIETIPPRVRRHIRALVCDNFRGSKTLAHRNHWVLQLCHFHLICQFQSRRGHWKPAIPGQKIREAIYQLVRQALELPDGIQLHRVLRDLDMIRLHAPTVRLHMLTREFIRNIAHYRSYRNHPELALPSTTNTIESMNRSVRDLMRRSRNLRTPESFQRWTIAFIRKRSKMVCNGKHYQPNKFV
jgi:transposase-like protein